MEPEGSVEEQVAKVGTGMNWIRTDPVVELCEYMTPIQ
jgi:hypothetical protein